MSDRDNAPHASDNGFEIGPVLEQARKDRGLSLAEVEQATKIRKRYLQGLERDDYGALPDAIYARGFLKTYANYLGLDGERLAWQLKNRRAPRRERLGGASASAGGFDEPLISPRGLSGTNNRRVSSATVLALVVGLVALGAVIGTLYYIGRGSGTAAEDPAPAEQQRAENEAGGGAADEAAASGDPSGSSDEAAEDDSPSGAGSGAGSDDANEGDEQEAPPVPEGLTAVITVEGAPSWLQVQSDGEVALEQVAQPGFSQTVEAREQIIINTGNAGAVSVEVNGQDLGTLGENGEVLTREIDLKAST